MRLPLTELLDVTAFIDSASGKKHLQLKRTASRSADVVVGQDALRRVFVLHAWAGRVPTTTHTDRIFKLVEDYRPKIVGIDASAMQSTYADSLLREARATGRRLPLVPVPMTGDKTARIRSVLQKVIAHGRLFVQDAQRDLWLELESFPNGLTMDLVDALAEAITLLPARPEKAQKAADGSRYIEYLKNSNAPAWYIQAAQSNQRGPRPQEAQHGVHGQR